MSGGRKGIESFLFLSTGLQISAFLFCCFYYLQQGEKDGEVKKQNGPSENIKNIKEEKGQQLWDCSIKRCGHLSKKTLDQH